MIILNILLLHGRLFYSTTKVSNQSWYCWFSKIKTDFDDKLGNFNKKTNSNKTKHDLVENDLNELLEKVKLLSVKDYNFLLGRMYFRRNDGSQNMFVYQTTFNLLELKKDKSTDCYWLEIKTTIYF